MTTADYIVIAAYLVFMLALGPVYQRFSSTASDYFRGGGGMLWWMVGASAWVMTFSAWTFTGGAAQAYSTGTFFLVLIVGNVLASIFTYLYTAHRYRQMRVITPIEAARDRFGRASEQWFTWLPVPINILRGGVGLYAIAIFMSVVFGVPISWIIIALGVIVTIMCVFGGSWAVVASDFVQMLTILVITLVVSFLALAHPAVGGMSGLLAQLPHEHFDWSIFSRPGVTWVFAITLILNQTVQMNSMIEGAGRFIFCKTGADAKRAVLIGLFGAIVFTPIFILPAMAARITHPDLSAAYPTLNNPAEASYVAMAMAVLPKGMLGLLVCGIFAATMSSMDSGLNRSAGIFVRNFWIVYADRTASESRQIFVGKIATLLFGLLQIGAGMAFISYQDLPLFYLILLLAAVFGLPMAVPLFFGMFIKRTPPWAGWSTMLVGIVVALVLQFSGVLSADSLHRWFAPDRPYNDIEIANLRVALTTAVVLAGCLGWFLLTIPFARHNKAAFEQQVDEFFVRMNAPIDPVAERVPGWEHDRMHYRVLGALCLIYGGFILLLMLLPNPMWGRMCFAFCGGTIALLGAILHRISKRAAPTKIDVPAEGYGALPVQSVVALK